MTHNDLNRGSTWLRNTTFIPNHGIRGRASVAIMVNLDARYGHHKLMQFQHDRIPVTSGPDKSASSSK